MQQIPTLTQEQIHQKVKAEMLLTKGIKIVREILTAEEIATAIRIAFKDDPKQLHLVIEEIV